MAYGRHVITGREQSVEKLFEQEKEHLLRLPSDALRQRADRVRQGGALQHRDCG